MFRIVYPYVSNVRLVIVYGPSIIILIRAVNYIIVAEKQSPLIFLFAAQIHNAPWYNQIPFIGAGTFKQVVYYSCPEKSTGSN